jgi:HSP20 family protein
MATQDSSRQQSADRSQGSAGSTQQGGSQAGQRGQAGGSSGAAQGPTAASGYGQSGRAGTAPSRYGVQSRGGAGYDVSPYAGGHAMGPFSLMHRISEEMDRLFESFGMGRNFFPEETAQGRRGGAGQGAASLWSPHLEVCERSGKLLIEVDLPGVKREDVNVQIEPDALIIQGQRTQQSERSDQGYYHSERSYGGFYRAVPLPEGIDAEQATATFRNGVLEIEMPMPKQQQRGRRLEVRDAGSAGGTTYEGTGGKQTSGGSR